MLDEIWRATYDFTTPLILNDKLVGTGTLATVDGNPGILTAAHVIVESSWDNSVGVRQALVTTLDHRASFMWLRMENLERWLASSGPFGEWSADLAFVRLPSTGPFTSQLQAKKSFLEV